jgi:thiol-disulfide isomerase/thioredoxin
MKDLLTHFFVFILLALAISLSASCTGSETGNAGGTNAGTTNSITTKKPSDYPPIPEKVDQAEMKNLDGSVSKVADRRGKVVLLNMWATWCGPCRGEMPALVKMQDEHRDQGFEIIGLNTDDGDTPEMVDEFAKEMKLNYTLVWAPTVMQTELLRVSKFGGIPQSFLIDRDGNLRGIFKGGGPSEVKKMGEWVAKVVNGEDGRYAPQENAKTADAESDKPGSDSVPVAETAPK